MLQQKKTALFDISNILTKIEIEAEQNVADLGCGNFGYFVFPMAKIVGKNGKVYAVDILKDVLKNIKTRATEENLLQIKAIWSDLEVYKATKIESESLDIATLVNVLSQSDKKNNIIKEAARVLKRGGKLAIIDWKKADTPLGPHVSKRLNKEELISFAHNNGLELHKEFIAGPYHYCLILLKI